MKFELLDNPQGNFYLENLEYANFSQQCINFYNLNLKASNAIASWSNGKSEISNNRPIMLNIWKANDGYYYDHTVVAYAWSIFRCTTNGKDYRFFKVRDGWSTNSMQYNSGRYVDMETMNFYHYYVTMFK